MGNTAKDEVSRLISTCEPDQTNTYNRRPGCALFLLRLSSPGSCLPNTHHQSPRSSPGFCFGPLLRLGPSPLTDYLPHYSNPQLQRHLRQLPRAQALIYITSVEETPEQPSCAPLPGISKHLTKRTPAAVCARSTRRP